MSLLVYAPNMSVIASYFQASECLNFHVPATMCGWTLAEATERTLRGGSNEKIHLKQHLFYNNEEKES